MAIDYLGIFLSFVACVLLVLPLIWVRDFFPFKFRIINNAYVLGRGNIPLGFSRDTGSTTLWPPRGCILRFMGVEGCTFADRA